MRRSALITRLERHLRLTDDERDALDWAERRELRVEAGQNVMEAGDPVENLFVVQLGWLHESAVLANGRRQIIRFNYAGDLIGTSSIAWASAATTLTAVTDCIVSQLPKAKLGRVFREQPRLAGLLYALAAAENVAMADRLSSISGTDALIRLSTLLLDMLARLRVTAGGVVDSFDMPLTQKDLADALGLTKVHVNRTLAEMDRRGLIERNGRRYHINDEAEMKELTGFIDRYAVIDTSWLPTPALMAA